MTDIQLNSLRFIVGNLFTETIEDFHENFETILMLHFDFCTVGNCYAMKMPKMLWFFNCTQICRWKRQVGGKKSQFHQTSIANMPKNVAWKFTFFIVYFKFSISNCLGAHRTFSLLFVMSHIPKLLTIDEKLFINRYPLGFDRVKRVQCLILLLVPNLNVHRFQSL